MKQHFQFAMVGAALLSATLAAQSTSKVSSSGSGVDSRRPVLVVDGADTLLQSGGWGDGDHLRTYADVHNGKYILFVSNGTLYRFDSPEKLAELERLNAPAKELSAQQKVLAAQQKKLADGQKPFAAQQAALSREMREAKNTADIQQIAAQESAVGHEQGVLGGQQGMLGHQQGEIGRQQGILGKQLYNRVQAMIDEGLLQKTCTPAEAEHAQL
jgi:hypothetical protein